MDIAYMCKRIGMHAVYTPTHVACVQASTGHMPPSSHHAPWLQPSQLPLKFQETNSILFDAFDELRFEQRTSFSIFQCDALDKAHERFLCL